jgi:hypothetical protein
MDPITTLILSAITLGVTSGLRKATERSIVDAYEYLKSVIFTRYSGQKKLLETLENMSTYPEDKSLHISLEQEIIKEGVNKDLPVIDAANAVLIAAASRQSKQRIERQRLQRKIKQVEAIENQVDLTIDEGQKVILQEKAVLLWEEICRLEEKINTIS